MTRQTTREATRAMYPHIISVGEGELHNLLMHEQPKAYTTDMYGWDADVYEIDGVAIVTGYKPFGDRPGDTNPSKEDELITKRLVEVGKIVGIEVLDHLIVSSDDFYSFKENGRL